MIIARRPGFTVLGADRLASWIGTPRVGEQPYAEQIKIGIHPGLPIGWANWGVAEVDGRELTTVVGDLIRDVPEEVWARPGVGTGVVRHMLLPMVEKLRIDRPDLSDRLQVHVAIAIGVGNMRLELINDDKVEFAARGLIKTTPRLEGFFVSRMGTNDEAVLGSPDESRRGTVERIARLLRIGMAEEKARAEQGLDLKCGLGGDVAVVDATNAEIAVTFSL